jgi:hypothetical protein
MHDCRSRAITALERRGRVVNTPAIQPLNDRCDTHSRSNYRSASQRPIAAALSQRCSGDLYSPRSVASLLRGSKPLREPSPTVEAHLTIDTTQTRFSPLVAPSTRLHMSEATRLSGSADALTPASASDKMLTPAPGLRPSCVRKHVLSEANYSAQDIDGERLRHRRQRSPKNAGPQSALHGV